MSGSPVPVAIDHLWPGGDRTVKRRAKRGDPRAERCMEAMGRAFAMALSERGVACTGCKTVLHAPPEIAAMSIAHLYVNPPLPALVFPFCRACATTEDRVKALAHLAMLELAGNGQGRRPDA